MNILPINRRLKRGKGEDDNMAIKPIDDHHARTTLLCLENTTNGKVLPLSYLSDVQHFVDHMA